MALVGPYRRGQNKYRDRYARLKRKRPTIVESQRLMSTNGSSSLPLPFHDKRRSEDFVAKNDQDESLNPRVWKQEPRSSTPDTYAEWRDGIIQICGDINSEEEFAKEIVAVSWLKYYRDVKMRKERRTFVDACPQFSEGINTSDDLFAILAYKALSEDTELERTKYTLFAALLHELCSKNDVDVQTIYYEDMHILHFALYFGYVTIARLLVAWGVSVNIKSPLSGKTALHVVCGSYIVADDETDKRLVEFLCEENADLYSKTEQEEWTPLFKAIQAQKPHVVKLLLEKFEDQLVVQLQHQDAKGDTPLHLAARINAKRIVDMIVCSAPESVRFQLLTTRNDTRQTPIHLASLHSGECLRIMMESREKRLVSWYTLEDASGLSPLDYAAKSKRVETFALMWGHVEKCTPVQVDSLGIDIKYLVRDAAKGNHSNWVLVNDHLKRITRSFIHTLLEGEKDDDSDSDDDDDDDDDVRALTLHEVLRADPGEYNKEHLESVRTFLDASIFGQEVVLGKVFDSDLEGVYDRTSVHRSMTLHAFLTSDLPVWGHPAIKGWVSNHMRLSKAGFWFFILSLFFYLVFLGSLLGALYLGARPEITPLELAQQYVGAVSMTTCDIWRMVLECVVLLYCIFILVQIVYNIYTLTHHYFKLFTVYLRIALVALVIALIICRAAASQGQWIVASLLFLAAVFLSMDYLIIFTFSNVYVLALWVIVRRDVLRFLVIATILTFAFSGGLYFALRAEQAPPNTTSAVVCVSTNSTDGNNSVNCVPKDAVTIVYPKEIFPLEKLLLANVQTVTEGSTITYDVYHIYTILLYLSFVVIILLLMINALIAQISHSYNEAQEQAAQMSTYATARFLMLVYPVCPGKCTCYQRVPCYCCCSNSDEIIWLSRSYLDKKKNHSKYLNVFKSFLRASLVTLQSIFLANDNLVATESTEKGDVKLADVKECVDSLAEIIIDPGNAANISSNRGANLTSTRLVSGSNEVSTHSSGLKTDHTHPIDVTEDRTHLSGANEDHTHLSGANEDHTHTSGVNEDHTHPSDTNSSHPLNDGQEAQGTLISGGNVIEFQIKSSGSPVHSDETAFLNTSV